MLKPGDEVTKVPSIGTMKNAGKPLHIKFRLQKYKKSMRQSYKSIKISTFAPENSNTNQTFARKRLNFHKWGS